MYEPIKKTSGIARNASETMEDSENCPNAPLGAGARPFAKPEVTLWRPALATLARRFR